MPSTSSIGDKIRQIAALIDTNDLNDWEKQFMRDVWRRTDQGTRTMALSEKQVDKIVQIYDKHFA